MTGGVSEAAKVVRALRAAHLHDGGRPALLQMACERIRSWGPPYTSVYAYMMHGDELQLEAHAGRDTEHTGIQGGKGGGGRGVAEKGEQNVQGVIGLGGGGGNYLAC